MKFENLEAAQEAYDELKGQVDSLEKEKSALLKKRDELLKELKDTKSKYGKFADYADQDLDIAELLQIKEKFEAGDQDAKKQYEQAYLQDKGKLEQRLKAIEEERAAEKAEREREREEALAAKLKADAISILSKESLGIRNAEQFWRLFGEGKVKRDEQGNLFVEGEYKNFKLEEYVESVAESEDNAHHFKPKGGSGSGTQASSSAGGKITNNPWKRETFNLTEQGRILKENRQIAERLKAEAGVK